MLCAVFRRMYLKIFVMILLTLSAICVFCFILNFMQSVFIYPASAAEHNKRMCVCV